MSKRPTFAQAEQILRVIRDQDPTKNQVQALLDSGVLADLFHPDARYHDREVIRRALDILPEVFILDMGIHANYSVTDRIARGKYDTVDPAIETRFDLPRVADSGVKEGRLIFFPDPLYMNGVLEEIKKPSAEENHNPWRPASLDHLLVFGEQYPREQLKYFVVALSALASIRHEEYVVALSRKSNDPTSRIVGLHSCTQKFHFYHRFLLVRDKSYVDFR